MYNALQRTKLEGWVGTGLFPCYWLIVWTTSFPFCCQVPLEIMCTFHALSFLSTIKLIIMKICHRGSYMGGYRTDVTNIVLLQSVQRKMTPNACTQTERLTLLPIFHHWRHRKLWEWQFPVGPVKTNRQRDYLSVPLSLNFSPLAAVGRGDGDRTRAYAFGDVLSIDPSTSGWHGHRPRRMGPRADDAWYDLSDILDLLISSISYELI